MIRNITLVPVVVAMLFLTPGMLNARNWRPGQIPNGNVFGCANCHNSPLGGGPRTPFGESVLQFVAPGSTAPFWGADLAALDSDGDGFTNGQELGDPDGDGTPTAGAPVSNPGVASSRPNSAPNFTSAPVTNAVIGIAYAYTATASDPEGGALTFLKITGPSWLTVSSGGAVSGTPPDGAAGVFTVTIRVRDNGSPSAARDQTYSLSVRASFAGWQQIHFALPAEQALAAREADPDADGIPNIVEYALRLNPRSASSFVFPAPGFDTGQRMTVAINTRDDDLNLTVAAEFADEVAFTNPVTSSGIVTDPVPSDGLRNLAFTDTVSKTLAARRFVRLRFDIAP